MGGGSFDANTYAAASTYRSAHRIDDFQYSTTTRSLSQDKWKAAPELDPKGVTRESRDSDEHPNSTPIIILFDVTGSMGGVPRVMQTKLPALYGLLLRKGYTTDPQILFGAIGDSETDRVPLQVGQFESDNRGDDQLRQIFLEGNGGGDACEGYEIGAFFAARNVVTDAWEKRGKKGYLFIIGDEKNKRDVAPHRVKKILDTDISEPISLTEMYREVQERWETFFILPNQTSYYHSDTHRAHWRDLLGERLILLDDPEAVCETIAAAIGVLEDAVDLDEALQDLAEIGSNAGSAVGRALATVSAGGSKGGVATLPPDLVGDDDI